MTRQVMIIYGLRGVTHGTAKVLTVMSPQGILAALEHVREDDSVTTYAAPRRLTQYHEKRSGGLERMIRAHNIIVLSKQDWDSKKVELGDAIWQQPSPPGPAPHEID